MFIYFYKRNIIIIDLTRKKYMEGHPPNALSLGENHTYKIRSCIYTIQIIYYLSLHGN